MIPHSTLIPWFVLVGSAFGQEPSLRLMRLFSDHMVLPRGETTLVKGRAAGGVQVELSADWLAAPVRRTADADGAFALPLPAPDGSGPFRFEVACGDARVAVEDVLVGDVWLASGQSNMEMAVGPSPTGPLGVDGWEAECAGSEVPRLRLFTVRRRVSMRPESDVLGEWRVCTPESARAFSATAFFFGRDLALRGKGPIGVVASSWGGTVCEAWTSADGLAEFPEFTPSVERVREQGRDADAPARRRAAFWSAVLGADAARPEPVSVAMPHVWSKHGLGAHDGVGVYRREVEVAQEWAGRELLVQLGPIDDMEIVLWDGNRIGGVAELGRWSEPRAYRVPADAATVGSHRLAVLVVDANGEGGVGGTAESFRVGPAEGSLGSWSLADGWSFQRGPSLRELPPLPDGVLSDPNVPTVLWNGMIAPLLPFPFAGAIWYQGESNRDRAAQYARLFPAMIRDWRAAFAREFPFAFVQIAPFGYAGDRGQTFELRLAQEAALSLPGVGMAVTTDIGDPRDLHPRQKRKVGERLAAQARWLRYGEPQAGLVPPRATAAARDGADVVVSFVGAGTWRCGKGGPSCFELAGADGVFRAAKARVDGVVVRVTCAEVPAPTMVRYAGSAVAMADLWNEFDLPLPPFALAVAR